MLRNARRLNQARGCVGGGITQLSFQLGPQLLQLLQVLFGPAQRPRVMQDACS